MISLLRIAFSVLFISWRQNRRTQFAALGIAGLGVLLASGVEGADKLLVLTTQVLQLQELLEIAWRAEIRQPRVRRCIVDDESELLFYGIFVLTLGNGIQSRQRRLTSLIVRPCVGNAGNAGEGGDFLGTESRGTVRRAGRRWHKQIDAHRLLYSSTI